MMDKAELKALLLSSLDQEIDEAIKAAQQAQEAAAHQDNQPENQYDTLSLEAAYLAHGQSERILQLQQDRIRLEKWQVPEFSDDDVIATGALVTLECDLSSPRLIWITPCASRLLNNQVQAVSAHTPLAQRLVGLGVDDEVSLPLGESVGVWCIESVQ